jgi:PhnB protein
MPQAVNPIPEGFHTVTPQLVCRNAMQALEFYKNALGAEIGNVAKDDRGNVMHAEIRIGDSVVMLSDEFPAYHSLSPLSLGGTAVS